MVVKSKSCYWMRFITTNSFMICFNCLYQHRYIGMFAGYFFYSLRLSLYIEVTVIKFLSVNTVICSSDSVTVSVQFVVALSIAITVKQLKEWWFIRWIVLSEFEQPGHKVLLGGGGGMWVWVAGRCIFLQVQKEVFQVGWVYGHSRGPSTTPPNISRYPPEGLSLFNAKFMMMYPHQRDIIQNKTKTCSSLCQGLLNFLRNLQNFKFAF